MSSNTAHQLEPKLSASYRDEMNFAEFPLALLGAPSPGQKTLEFSDKIFDYKRESWITRKLTISASDRSSLPTPRDEEVFLGLVNLSHQAGFQSREVFFSKGELVKLLGWSDDGRSYQRIDEALKKWASLTLYWENWWSKEEMSFIDRTFHILDNVDSISKDRYRAKVSNAQGNTRAGLSSFAWNSVIFSSFKSGYIKKLDLDFYKDLSSAVSKKIFRFLDKRFYNESCIELDLRAFAFEHIGLSRSYHNSAIKRLLAPAIKELEDKGFLRPLGDAERYLKQSRGIWRIVFVKAKGKTLEAKLPDNILVSELTKRGVSLKAARELIENFDNDRINNIILNFDALVSANDKKVSKNPAGFLVAAIKNNFDFETKKAKESPEVKKVGALRPFKPLEEKPASAADIQAESLRSEFEAFWDAITDSEREAFETEAVAQADKFSKAHYFRGKERGGALFDAVRKSLLLKKFTDTKN
jgi:hypothetical protein